MIALSWLYSQLTCLQELQMTISKRVLLNFSLAVMILIDVHGKKLVRPGLKTVAELNSSDELLHVDK